MAEAQEWKNEFLGTWKRAAEYSVELAEIMPEEKYDYTPSENVRSFRGQLEHIIQNLYMLNGRFVLDDFQRVQIAEDASKEEVIKAMKTSFEYVYSTLLNMDEEQLEGKIKFFTGDEFSRRHIFELMRDHMTHHRGQLIIYLRMNNLEPPRYRGW